VSEPAAIAALFEECDEEHDHTTHKEIDLLSDVAKLDTIVTVVDSAHFFQNLGPKSENMDAPRLLMDQVEYSNVVLLNKTDLVSDEQLSKVREHVRALNSKAKIISCKESSIDVSEVVNTGLFKREDFNLEGFTTMFEGVKPKSCCKSSIAKGESPCCLRARTIDSGLSTVLLPSKKNNKTRHGDQYQITSFVYKARRPFNPTKIHEKFIDTYFVVIEEEEEEEENSEAEETAEEKESGEIGHIEKLQEEGAKKMALRSDAFGNLLRMKGFVWNASSHDLVGFFSVASNVARIESPGTWACLDEKAYTGTDAEKTKLRKDWAGDWGDRRQELVFIGQGLKHKEIQQLLDSCLLGDDEMAMGVDGWKATFGDVFLKGE
jgi:G3E family GTPase